MHTVFALLCFVMVIHWLIFPYPSGLLHWHCGNLAIAPVPAKQPWWIWINTSCEFIMNDCITTTKQSTTKSCAHFLGYTVDMNGDVYRLVNWWIDGWNNKHKICIIIFVLIPTKPRQRWHGNGWFLKLIISPIPIIGKNSLDCTFMICFLFRFTIPHWFWRWVAAIQFKTYIWLGGFLIH